MRRIKKALFTMQEVTGSELPPRHWVACASVLPAEINAPRGAVVIYLAQRLTLELMGDRRKLNDDEIIAKRMYFKEMCATGPATAVAIRDALDALVGDEMVVEDVPPSEQQ